MRRLDFSLNQLEKHYHAMAMGIGILLYILELIYINQSKALILFSTICFKRVKASNSLMKVYKCTKMEAEVRYNNPKVEKCKRGTKAGGLEVARIAGGLKQHSMCRETPSCPLNSNHLKCLFAQTLCNAMQCNKAE